MAAYNFYLICELIAYEMEMYFLEEQLKENKKRIKALTKEIQAKKNQIATINEKKI